jgi:hypothetical protein
MTNCSGVPEAGTFENAYVVMLAAIVKSTTLPLFMLIVVVDEEVIAWRVLFVKPPPPIAETHAVPLDVSTLPAVPGLDKPVPPSAAGTGVTKPSV